MTTLLFFGLGKKSTKSTTPSSSMYRVCRMFDDGRYCCFVVHSRSRGGEILKCPPLSLSRSLQKTLGESKSGLRRGRLADGFDMRSWGSSPTHEIHAAIYANHGTCSHIANQTIILDRQIPGAVAPHTLDCGWYLRDGFHGCGVAGLCSSSTRAGEDKKSVVDCKRDL